MNISNMSLLTNEQQIEFKQWTDFFASAGFRQMKRRAAEQLAAVETAILTTVEDERGLYYFRGQRAKLLDVVHFEEAQEAYYESLVGQREYTREEQEESFGANA